MLHPPGSTEIFESADDLEAAYAGERLRPFPNQPARYGLRRDPRMGELAGRVDTDRELLRGLRPEALALALYVADAVRAIADTDARADRHEHGAHDRRTRSCSRAATPRRRAPTRCTRPALPSTSRRDYRSRAQAGAFQYMLDRLQSLNLIAWVREPGAIHITVSSEARELIQR